MSMKAKQLPRSVKIVLNFYTVVGGIALFWMLLFDQNNILDQFERRGRIRQMEADLEFYTSEKTQIQESRYMLESEAAELERFARERYRMKRDDEDLFIIVEPNK